MFTFPELIRKIREEASLTQPQFAKVLGVSSVLIAMIETGQKEVSKNFLVRLAKVMNVSPLSITPFLFVEEQDSDIFSSKIERSLVSWAEKMQVYLIKDRAEYLRKHANE